MTALARQPFRPLLTPPTNVSEYCYCQPISQIHIHLTIIRTLPVSVLIPQSRASYFSFGGTEGTTEALLFYFPVS